MGGEKPINISDDEATPPQFRVLGPVGEIYKQASTTIKKECGEIPPSLQVLFSSNNAPTYTQKKEVRRMKGENLISMPKNEDSGTPSPIYSSWGTGEIFARNVALFGSKCPSASTAPPPPSPL